MKITVICVGKIKEDWAYNKIDKKVLEYSIMGDAFIGSSFNMIGDLDNSSQNLIISMERDKIHKEIKNKGKK